MPRFLSIALLGLLLPTLALAGGSLLNPLSVPDIDTFMQIGYAASANLTPDGQTVYFMSNASGVNQAYRVDLNTGWPYQLTVFTEGIDFYSLSPTADHMVCGVGLGGDENAQLWLLDARTGEAEALTQSPEIRHGAPAWSPDGTTIYFNSNESNGRDFYIYEMNLETREKSVLVEMEGWNGPGDVSRDGRYLLVTHWDSNANSDMYRVNIESGSLTHLTQHDGEAVYQSGQFSPDGERIYLLSNANPDGIARRAWVSPDAGQIQFLDTEGPWEVQGMRLSRDRSVMGWTVNEDGYTRLKLWDLSRNRELPAPAVDGLVAGFSFSNGSEIAFSFSSAASTNDVWLWRWSGASRQRGHRSAQTELVKVTHSTYAGVDPTMFVEPELVRYPSFDGLEIPAFLYLPPDYTPGEPVPFVIHAHGGPESQFQPTFIRHFQFLLLNGFGVLAPNVRGSSGYGKEYMDLDNYKNRLDSVKDLKAAADFLLEKGYTAPGLLAVKGGSYGGYMTLAAITEYPGLFSAAVDQVGIANFVTFLENTADYRRHLREAEYGPLTDREFLTSISPIHKADLIETPLLVVHGANDPRVPVGEAQQIADAIEARGGVVELLIFEDEGHGASKRENVLVTYRRMVEFLSQHLKQQAP